MTKFQVQKNEDKTIRVDRPGKYVVDPSTKKLGKSLFGVFGSG